MSIKKIVAFILAAALCLSGTVLAEEESGIAAADFLGEWVVGETAQSGRKGPCWAALDPGRQGPVGHGRA